MSGGLSGIDVDVVILIVSWIRANVPTVMTSVRQSGNALGFWFEMMTFVPGGARGFELKSNSP